MNIKRIWAMGFVAVILAVSGLSAVNPAQASSSSSSAPILEKAKAVNTGGTSAFEAGDSILLKFSETTNKYPVNASNIMDVFNLSGGKSFLDGSGGLGGAEWSDDGEELVIILSDATSLPNVKVGDVVSIKGNSITDLDNQPFLGRTEIKGNFTSTDDDCIDDRLSVTRDDDDDDDSDDSDDDKNKDDDSDDSDDDCDEHRGEHGKFRCGHGLQNGRLYKLADSPTVYLMAACKLKPFRGEAAFKSRGHKFQEVQVLSALPNTVTVVDEPVVPAEGTLVKGSDATVWFVSKNGKRKGFTSATVFTALGFKFDQVDQISDSDLNTIQTDTELVDDSSTHPDGALIRCSASPAIFLVSKQLRFPFANIEAFTKRGHRFEHVLIVDCNRFSYKEAPAITQ